MKEPELIIRQLSGDRMLAGIDRPARPMMLVARYLVGPVRPLPAYEVRVPLAPSALGALAVEVGALPHRYSVQQMLFPPDHPGLAVSEPWIAPVASDLLLPATIASDLNLRRNLSATLQLDPRDLPIPASGDALKGAAERVLQNARGETVLRVAMHWAFACDVSHRDGDGLDNALPWHSLSVPRENVGHIQASANRLVVPQSLRVVAVDAVARNLTGASSDGRTSRYEAPSALDPLVYAYFPSLSRWGPPTHAEIRTALWLLAFDSPLDEIPGSPTAWLMAVSFGRQSVGEPYEALDRWLGLLDTPDDHPHGAWTTKDAPSHLRRALRTGEGLDLRDVVVLVRDVLPLMVHFQDVGNQLWTAAALAAALSGVQDRDRSDAWSFLERSLVRRILELDDGCVCALAESELREAGGDMIARRKAIEQWLIERPFLEFSDGVLVPVGLPDTAYGVIHACEASANPNPKRGRWTQRVGNILGLCFQASVAELAHGIPHDQTVIDVDVIDRVVDSVAGKHAKRADLAIGDAQGCYVVIEATRRNLLGDIRYGDERALREWNDIHLGKLQQVESTKACLDEIAKAAGGVQPQQSVGLVVCDLPLPQTAGLRALFDRQSGVRHPPFICSIVEFELLVEKAHARWSIPSLIVAWQQSRPDRPLGHFLAQWPHG